MFAFCTSSSQSVIVIKENSLSTDGWIKYPVAVDSLCGIWDRRIFVLTMLDHVIKLLTDMISKTLFYF